MVMSAHPRSLPTVKSEPRIIPAGEFKAKCLKLMDDVATTKQPVTVTKRGKPVGQFVPMPAEDKPFRSLFGRSPGGKILGDIMKPMYWPDASEKWDRVMADEKPTKSKRKKQK